MFLCTVKENDRNGLSSEIGGASFLGARSKAQKHPNGLHTIEGNLLTMSDNA